jgi:hypothetical protein
MGGREKKNNKVGREKKGRMNFMLGSKGRKTETTSITLNKKEKGNKLGSSLNAQSLKLYFTFSPRHIL